MQLRESRASAAKPALSLICISLAGEYLPQLRDYRIGSLPPCFISRGCWAFSMGQPGGNGREMKQAIRERAHAP